MAGDEEFFAEVINVSEGSALVFISRNLLQVAADSKELHLLFLLSTSCWHFLLQLMLLLLHQLLLLLGSRALFLLLSLFYWLGCICQIFH